MRLKVQTKRLLSTGTDTGMLMLGRADVLEQKFKHTDKGQIFGPTLVLKDGRRLKSAGVDFFDWGKPIEGIGRSANALIESGDAVLVPYKPPVVGKMTYSSAANSTLGPLSWGVLQQSGASVPTALTFSVGCDGGYFVQLALDPKGGRFGFIDIAEGRSEVVVVPLALIETKGKVAIGDPCQPQVYSMDVAADADGDTTIYGAFDPDTDRLSGIAFPL